MSTLAVSGALSCAFTVVMPKYPAISLLLREVERDLVAATMRAANPATLPATARIAHLLAAADIGLVTQELADRAGVESEALLMAYELGRALGPSTHS